MFSNLNEVLLVLREGLADANKFFVLVEKEELLAKLFANFEQKFIKINKVSEI